MVGSFGREKTQKKVGLGASSKGEKRNKEIFGLERRLATSSRRKEGKLLFWFCFTVETSKERESQFVF